MNLKQMMSLVEVEKWQRWWSRLTSRPRLEAGDTAYPFDSYTMPDGTAVNVDTAMGLSAVWSCSTIRSETIGSLPVHVKDKDRRLADDHPLFDLLHNSPNFDMTAGEWFVGQVAGLDFWGNGYSRIEKRDNGTPSVLLPFNPEYMRVKRNVAGGMRYEYTVPGKDMVPYDEDEILHFRGFSLDGLVGLSPLRYAAEALGSQLAANRAAAHEFRNSLKVGGFLKTPANVSLEKPAREKLRKNLSYFGQPENAGKFMLLEAGVELVDAKNFRMNPTDAQLLESRGFGIEEICRFYRVPPPLIGHTDKASSWASSLTNLNQYFLTYSIRPTVHRMEQTMRKRLLSKADQANGFDIKFNLRALLRGNFTEQMAAYVQALLNGINNLDEIREYEDLPPLPDGLGRQYRVPMNTEPAGDGGDEPGQPGKQTNQPQPRKREEQPA